MISYFRNNQRRIPGIPPSFCVARPFPSKNQRLLGNWNTKPRLVWFSADGKNIRFPSVHTGDNPFDVLGIPKNSTYETVKRRFVELAKQTHPDMSFDDDDRKSRRADDFIRLRQAFECIQESSDGTARLVEEGEESPWSDDNFKAWFYEETGHQDVMFTMDLATRKEVVDMANSQSQGGLDRGGMWEMARNMADQERNLKNKKQSLAKESVGVEAGKQGEKTSPRRRRRRT